jgi:transposase
VRGLRDDLTVTDVPSAEDPRDALIREQAERLAVQDRQLAQLAVQAEQTAALEAMVADLRGRLETALRSMSRNSGNSSMPPSSDDRPGRKPPRRERRAAERAAARKQGKQPGSPGASMAWEVPDRTEEHFPEGACACGRDLAGAADGPRLRALAVYLVVFQHVPVERCRLLIADVTGVVSDGFVHSCLARAASLLKDVVALIRELITAAPVAGFDETTLRSGPAGEKKYVHGAFTERLSAFWLGSRSLDSMEEAGILPGFAGIVVSGRHQNYFSPRWVNITGNQACLSHLLRDYEDCAETYPGAVWPV